MQRRQTSQSRAALQLAERLRNIRHETHTDRCPDIKTHRPNGPAEWQRDTYLDTVTGLVSNTIHLKVNWWPSCPHRRFQDQQVQHTQKDVDISVWVQIKQRGPGYKGAAVHGAEHMLVKEVVKLQPVWLLNCSLKQCWTPSCHQFSF